MEEVHEGFTSEEYIEDSWGTDFTISDSSTSDTEVMETIPSVTITPPPDVQAPQGASPIDLPVRRPLNQAQYIRRVTPTYLGHVLHRLPNNHWAQKYNWENLFSELHQVSKLGRTI